MWFEDMDAYNDYIEWRDSDAAQAMKESEESSSMSRRQDAM
jgi:hypothetical protein